MKTDDEILATADPALVLNKEIQLAHDRMMLVTSGPEGEEYARCWRQYLDVGGDLGMIDNRIDNENWKRHRVRDYSPERKLR